MKNTIIFLCLPLITFLFNSCNEYRKETELISSNGGINQISLQPTSTEITSLKCSHDNKIWIGTKNGINIYDGYSYTQYIHNKQNALSILQNQINTLFEDHANNMWIGTNSGLCQYSPEKKITLEKNSMLANKSINQITETLDNRIFVFADDKDVFTYKENEHWEKSKLSENPTDEKAFLVLIPDNEGGIWKCMSKKCTHYNKNLEETKSINFDTPFATVKATRSDKHLWLLHPDAIRCLDLSTGEILYTYTMQTAISTTFVFYEKPYLYINGSKGLFRFHETDHNLENIEIIKGIKEFGAEFLNCIESNKKGIHYYGYEYNGLLELNNSNRNRLNSNELFSNLFSRNVTAAAYNNEDEILVGSKTKLFQYNLKTGKVISILNDNIFSDALPWHSSIMKIVPGKDKQHYWLTTDVRIVYLNTTNDHFEKELSKIHLHRIGDIVSLGDSCLMTSSGDSLYIIHKNGSLTPIPMQNNMYSENSKITRTDETHAIVCTQGLLLYLVDLENKIVQPLEVSNQNSYSNLIPSCIALKDQHLWIGTNGQGAYDYDMVRKEIKPIELGEFLNIRSILPVKSGDIYFATKDNLISYQPETNDITKISTNISSLHNFSNFHNDGLIEIDDKIFICSNNGGFFLEEKYDNSLYSPNLGIKQIKIEYNVGSQEIVADVSQDTYVFPFNKNNLRIYFGGLKAPSDIMPIYEYHLKGNNDNWKRLMQNESWSASFSNLLPGTYQLQMRIRPSEKSRKVLSEKKVTIIIKPHPLLSTTAISLYLLLLTAAIWLLFRIRYQTKEGKLKLGIALNEEKRQRETNEMNISFFANIAHEFRNPLTLIAGPVSSLYEDKTLAPSAIKKLNVVSKSVNRMLKLIDQMLDFNKLESDVLKLQVAEYDVNFEIKKWIDLFEASASYSEVKVQRVLLDHPCNMWIDHDKVDKILNNLFTNALKHTPREGIIRIGLDIQNATQVKKDFNLEAEQLMDETYLQIYLYNNGNSIELDKIDRIFNRYYQNIDQASQKRIYGWGTGIGLYYVKQLIHIHHGFIRVYNEPQGGVTFSFVIPMSASAYSTEEHVKDSSSHIMQMNYYPTSIQKYHKTGNDLNQKINAMTKRPVMLIIDDDYQIADFIKSLFEDTYQTICRYSAEDALANLEEVNPSIILCDVIMLHMTGYEFCTKLKKDPMFCHIPVVLITGKSSMQEQIQGLQLGAVAYVPKPFHPDYLKAIVESLHTNFTNLQKSLSDSVDISHVKEGLSPSDKEFMDQLYNFMEDHISDEDIDMPTICRHLLVGKSKFSYKVKALTGETPVAFFKKYKLNRAAKLLESGKYNVSEVAAMTGFNTLSYFSVCFKKQFGINPSDIIRS